MTPPLGVEQWMNLSQSSSISSSSPSGRFSWALDAADQPSVIQTPILTTPITQGSDGHGGSWTPPMPPYPIRGTLYGYSPQQPPDDSCQCLRRVVLLMGEHDEAEGVTSPQSLDAVLASLKEAIHYGNALLMCRRCQTRPENMTILTFLTDRLTATCEGLVIRLHEGLHNGAWVQDDGLGSSDDEVRQQQHITQGKASPAISLWLGCYEMDSAVELGALLRCLSITQLRALNALVDKLQRHASGQFNCDLVGKKAVAARTQVHTLLQKLNAVPVTG
ncbi:hypothetical protein F5B18DRAFT_594183 [Nemania serpens]|nr:hypothetical protein F5B18DRAFT_594183 [Nemania serpens]